MKGQAILTWVIGLAVIFALIIVYNIFVPTVSVNIGDAVYNQTSGTSTSMVEARGVIDTVRMALPLGLFVLVVGVILYMVAATQKDEAHEDIM